MSENHETERSYNYMSMFLTIVVIATIVVIGVVMFERNRSLQVTEMRESKAASTPAPVAPVIVNPTSVPTTPPVVIYQQAPAAAPAAPAGGKQSVTITQPASAEPKTKPDASEASDKQSSETDTSSTSLSRP